MPPEKQKKEPRLSNSTIGLMIAFTLAFDILEALLGLIPIAGWIANIGIDFFVFAMLYLWYMLHGVNFTRTRAMVFMGLGLLKFIPLIQEFPLWTLDVIAVGMMVRIEDKSGISLNKKNLASGAKKITKGLGAAVKNKNIAGLLNRSEQGRQFRQQILQSQRQSLAEKKSEHSLPKTS